MSTVRYNLRLRPSAVTSTGPVSDSGESPIAESFAEISPPSANLELDPAELVEAPVTTDTPARSYSGVVRSGLNEPRSPSPAEESLEGALPTLNDIIAERNRLECRSWAQVKEDERRSLEARRKAAEALGHDRFWEQGGRWFTTTHRRPRAKSFEGQLTQSQADTVRQAEEGMNLSQQNLLRRREQATQEEQTPEFRGEGTSKGKNPDPRNWGTAGIPEEELDVAAQQAALGAYEAQRISEEINSPEISEIHSAAVNIELMNENQNLRAELAKLKKDKATLKKKKAKKQKAKRADAKTLGKSEMRPSTQLAPKSYLGSVLKGMDNSSDEDGNTSSDPSDSSDSDTSESSSSSSDGSDSSSENDKKKRKRRSKRSRKSSKKKASKTRIRPVEPEKYNGEPDPKVFHRFATQSKAYVNDGQVPRKRRVSTIGARFLTDKAYDFYIREASNNPEKWGLGEFMEQLFNYCFPVDFKTQQRKKLKRCYQNNRPVKEFVSEINELFTTIGFTDERERVNKLWFGLRSDIQKALWKERLNPEESDWDSIVEAAEIHEIADAVEVGQQRAPKKPATIAGDPGTNPRRFEPNTGQRPAREQTNQGTYKSNNQNNRPGRASTNRAGPSQPKRDERPRTRPQDTLSKEKKEELQGKCYLCFEAGHLARNCAKGQMVTNQGNGPPGVANFSLEVQLDETERLRKLADTTESIEEIELGMVLIQDHLSLNEQEPSYIRQMGDPLAQRLEDTLTRHQPYPGDCIPKEEKRFSAYRTANGMHVIIDFERDSDLNGECVLIPSALVEDGEFDIPEWYAKQLLRVPPNGSGCRACTSHRTKCEPVQDPLAARAEEVLKSGTPYPGDADQDDRDDDQRFEVWRDRGVEGVYVLYDKALDFHRQIPADCLRNEKFNLVKWYWKQLRHSYLRINAAFEPQYGQPWSVLPLEDIPEEDNERVVADLVHEMLDDAEMANNISLTENDLGYHVVELFGQQIKPGTLPAIQRNTVITKDANRTIPKPIVVVANIDGHPARALIDSGSLGDFMSSTLAEQLAVKKIKLDVPLQVQLAVQGSRSKVNYGGRAQFAYQGINEQRYFDIINISSYDLILGTPFLYQHKVTFGINPPRVVIGAPVSEPLRGVGLVKLASRATMLYEENLERVREELLEYAQPLCCENISQMEFPPLRAINHRIPLKDEAHIAPFRPSRCPEALRDQWHEKRDAYLNSGRWEITTARSTAPMMFIFKPGTNLMRSVYDLRSRNENTHKLASPLPPMDGVLRRCASHQYMSAADIMHAFDCVRIEPEDVWKTACNTPDGNMVSHVIQMGDCNAPATYQALMNHIFSPYIGRFLDVYLDDIIIYSNSLAEHVQHVKLVIDILRKEKFYLNKSKLQFLCSELRILGRVVDKDGIRMDPDKVDTLVNWKTPTNRDLLRGFLGVASFLADDIDRVRIPMGVLHAVTGDTVPFRWDFTLQRAFEDVKRLAVACKGHHRKPLEYGADKAPINIVTDGCATGIAGVVSQGENWQTAKVAAFFSAKLNSAQQNYPVHEIEMLAGIETMMRHRDILQGTHFIWFTDHKALIHLVKQKNLSGRQARWMERISEFNFEIRYVPGVENLLSDALSRIYSNESPGTIRAHSEYTYHDVIDDDNVGTYLISMPLLVGLEGQMAATPSPARKTKEITPAESGRPETSKEFASRMKTHVKITGPRALVNKVIPESQSAGQTVEVRSDEEVLPTTLLDIVNNTQLGLDIREQIRNKYEGDLTFRSIVEKPKDFRNFLVEDGLVFLKLKDRKILCIPQVTIKGRSVKEIVIAEAHSLLAHLGARKTIAYLRDHVWWKNIVPDVTTFCETCRTCKRSKPSNQKPYGLLNPLAVPSRPWEAIGIDFVGPLPESKDRDAAYDSITVVIDLLTAMVHLIPSRTNYTAKQVAELVFSEIYKLHGLPRAIISDRDPLFTSVFWNHLHSLIGTSLRMSSAYHPESDGSTERANRTVTQMLRQCIDQSQKDWVSKLPAIEFAINLSRSESTGYAPFFLNTGRMPRSLIWNNPDSSEYPGVRVFAQKLRNAIMTAHDSVIAARVKHTRTANRKRQLAPFQEQDLVYLSTKNISLTNLGLARKLIPKFIGPYRIVKDFGNNSFKLELPVSLKRRGIHDVFHASCLKPHVPNDDRLFPGRLHNQVFTTLEDGGNEWAVDAIIGHISSGENAVFKIKWKSGDVTWMPFRDIAHLGALPAYLELVGVSDITELPEGTDEAPPEDPQVLLASMEWLPVEARDQDTEVSMQDARHEWLCEVYLPTLAERMTVSQTPSDQHSSSSHRSTRTRSLPSIMSDNFSVNLDLRIILKGRDDVYRVHNDRHEVDYVLSLEQLRLIVAYEAAIRVANARGTPYPDEIPGGFVRLQRDYDREPLMRHNGFSVYSDGHWISPPGDAPSYLDFAIPVRRNLDDGVKDKKTIYKLEQRIKGYEQDAMARANAAERRDDAIATRRALKELGQSSRPSNSGRGRATHRGRGQRNPRSLSPAASVATTARTYRRYDSPPPPRPPASRSRTPVGRSPTPDDMEVDQLHAPEEDAPAPPADHGPPATAAGVGETIPPANPAPDTTVAATAVATTTVATTTGAATVALATGTPETNGTQKSLKALGRIPKKTAATEHDKE